METSVERSHPADAQTVRALIERPSLGLSVLAGADGLDRPVTWAHVSELEDPTPWLDRDQLVLTAGIGLPRTGMSQVSYLERLHARGAAALAVGEQLSPNRNKPRPAMLAEADRLGFPVLRVSDDVAFVAIVKSVADSSHAVTRRRLMPYLHLLDAMRLRTESNDGSRAMFARLEEITGYSLVLASPAGIDLVGKKSLPTETIAALAGAALNPLIPSGFAVPVVIDAQPAAYLVALEREGAEGVGLTIVQHVATLAMFELLEIFRRRETQRIASSEVVQQLLGGIVAEPAPEHLASCGIYPSAGVMVHALRPESGHLDEATVDYYLHDRAIAHALGHRDQRIYVLTGSAGLPKDAAVDLRSRIGSAAPRTTLTEIVFARREAVWALENAVTSSKALHQHFGGSSSDYWLPTDLDLLRGLIDSELGDVIRYDRAHGTELMRSLTTYFRNERNLSSAADVLFIHKHTLAYRLRRIKELTGRDVNGVGDGSQLWLALRALAVLGDESVAAGGWPDARLPT